MVFSLESKYVAHPITGEVKETFQEKRITEWTPSSGRQDTVTCITHSAAKVGAMDGTPLQSYTL